ncbi:YHS domain-containing (seleno)protein [Devosia aquimaris]|uniref:YHS domain-containing (seleno)protein n=1 Tax=Devosia aquimaris TaxID=2866214 RepID=UPI001CD15676|nr:YHS domain-containing (seleno)protein [Devosia sp. CJK-A8-3]
MTQTYKQILTMLAFVLPLFGLASGGLQLARAQSVVTLIVTDPLTGIAMSGMDPVSYFTEPAPLQGSPDYEFTWNNVPWYFSSPANRDVFSRAPEIYAPQFGGHDGMGVARGFLSDGDARFFALFKQRLYLFYSASNREAFLLAPDAAATQAEARWPELAKTLSIN